MIQADYVGVDIAKDKFDVAIHINNRYKHSAYSNDLKGHTEFAEWLIKNTTSPWVCTQMGSGLESCIPQSKFKP